MQIINAIAIVIGAAIVVRTAIIDNATIRSIGLFESFGITFAILESPVDARVSTIFLAFGGLAFAAEWFVTWKASSKKRWT